LPPPARVVEVFVAQNPNRARPSSPVQIGLKPRSSRTTSSDSGCSQRTRHQHAARWAGVRQVGEQRVGASVVAIFSTERGAASCRLRPFRNEPAFRLLIWNEGPPPDFKIPVKAPLLLFHHLR